MEICNPASSVLSSLLRLLAGKGMKESSAVVMKIPRPVMTGVRYFAGIIDLS